jgi:hypothetical protein
MKNALLVSMLGLAIAAGPAGAAPSTPSGGEEGASGTAQAAHSFIASPGRGGTTAIGAETFLSSLGVNTHVDQGYNPDFYAPALRFLGVRNIRDGERNLAGDIMLHRRDGIRVDVVGADVSGLIAAARTLAEAGALLSIEGPNEPNNFPITYAGQRGGGTSGSWLAVAKLQRDLYRAVKSDPVLRHYPVFDVSEGGAENDNVGLQFLTIPAGAGTVMPEGTRYADYANAHNYVSGNGDGYVNNQAWLAADPTLNGRWDGLFGEYGITWKRHFRGYPNARLQTLPRVTTETGWDSVSDVGGERTQGVVLVNTYLAQFTRGWRYTFIYELGDGQGGSGHQGLFRSDWTPKPAAIDIHDLTSILADDRPVAAPGRLDYSIPNQPATVHDLLLQKSDGLFELVVWGEQVFGSNAITIRLGGVHPEVKIYDVTIGTRPIETLHDVSTVPLMVSDHAMIVEID